MDPVPLVHMAGAAILSEGRRVFPGTTWSILPGQHWAVIGPTGSGKSTLARALWDGAPVVDGTISWPAGGPRSIRHVTFEDQHQRIARYSRYLQGRYESLEDGSAPTAARMLDEAYAACAPAPRRPGGMPSRDGLLRALGLRAVMDREVSRLSNGEIRKLLLAEALLAGPLLLVLEEPMQGLDRASRRRLSALLARAARGGTTFVFVTSRAADVPRWVCMALRVHEGEIRSQSPWSRSTGVSAARASRPAGAARGAVPVARVRGAPGPVIVDLRRVTVRQGHETVLDRVSWRIREGESWALVGPNGSGKTTLLSLLLADHPQAYANDVRVFGRQRGDGQGIWEIKELVGHVSPEAQALEAGQMTVRECVQQGAAVRPVQATGPGGDGETAQEWIAEMGLAGLEDRVLASLSDGQKRLALLARAVAGAPRLLVLDEPCQGLDEEHGRAVREAVERLGSTGGITLVYVTHEPREIPACVTRVLALRAGRARRRPLLLLRLAAGPRPTGRGTPAGDGPRTEGSRRQRTR